MERLLETPSGETRLFPILGSPVAYTKSPRRLTLGFASRGANAVCIPRRCLQAASIRSWWR